MASSIVPSTVFCRIFTEEHLELFLEPETGAEAEEAQARANIKVEAERSEAGTDRCKGNLVTLVAQKLVTLISTSV